MYARNVFCDYGRPIGIPSALLEQIPDILVADTEYADAARDIGALIPSETGPMTDADTYVFGAMLARIANRPSTVSPLLIGIIQKTDGSTIVCARWRRMPEWQWGYSPDWKDRRRTMDLTLELPVPYAASLRQWKTFGSMMGFATMTYRSDLYVIIPRRRCSSSSS